LEKEEREVRVSKVMHVYRLSHQKQKRKARGGGEDRERTEHSSPKEEEKTEYQNLKKIEHSTKRKK